MRSGLSRKLRRTARFTRFIRLSAVRIQHELLVLKVLDVPIPVEVSAWVRDLQERHAEPSKKEK